MTPEQKAAVDAYLAAKETFDEVEKAQDEHRREGTHLMNLRTEAHKELADARSAMAKVLDLEGVCL